MATTRDRNTLQREGSRFTHPVAADAVILAGTIVCLSAGNAVPGGQVAGLITVGIADAGADNTGGAAGALSVDAMLGTFLLANAATDTLTTADIGAECYVFDNETVARTDGGVSRPVAGRVRQVEAGGVWVTFA